MHDVAEPMHQRNHLELFLARRAHRPRPADRGQNAESLSSSLCIHIPVSTYFITDSSILRNILQSFRNTHTTAAPVTIIATSTSIQLIESRNLSITSCHTASLLNEFS